MEELLSGVDDVRHRPRAFIWTPKNILRSPVAIVADQERG